MNDKEPAETGAALERSWLPQRGLFAFGRALFEPLDGARHKAVAQRRAAASSSKETELHA